MAVIFQTYSIAEAHLKVHITKNSGLADLFVYSVSNVGMAKGDSLWHPDVYYTLNEIPE